MKILISLFLLLPSLSYAFKLDTSSVKDKDNMPNKHVFNSFGCKGDNISPALEWSDPPKGTKSFAITVYDPDAPTGSGWWHWIVVNIPANVNKFEEGKVPEGVLQTRTDFGKSEYGGPCPPPGSGVHHYRFMVHALKVDKLPDLNAESSGAMAGYMINANAIDTARLTIKYRR